MLTQAEYRCLEEIARGGFDVRDRDIQARVCRWRNPVILFKRGQPTLETLVAMLLTRHLIQSRGYGVWGLTGKGCYALVEARRSTWVTG